MQTFRLVWALVRVPRLFLSLLLWPLLLGGLVLLAQTALSIAYLKSANSTSKEVRSRLERKGETAFLRLVIFGDKRPLPPPVICRWIENRAPVDCQLEPLDLVVRTSTPQDIDPSPYVSVFGGAVRRIHLCTNCRSDVLIDSTKAEAISQLRGWKAFAIYSLADSIRFRDVGKHFVSAIEKRENVDKLKGEIELAAPGLPLPLNMSELETSVVLVANIAIVINVALWMALRAHRKVLDYFSHSNALLPLVAACGKGVFYRALWCITALRVAAFLGAALLPLIFMFRTAEKFVPSGFQFRSTPEAVMWACAVALSLGAMTTLVSIGDLRQRESWLSVVYKFVPFVICFVGGVLWGTALFGDGAFWRGIQSSVAVLPVIGLFPLLVSPISVGVSKILVLHALLAAALTVYVLRGNSHWLAAHLEEV